MNKSRFFDQSSSQIDPHIRPNHRSSTGDRIEIPHEAQSRYETPQSFSSGIRDQDSLCEFERGRLTYNTNSPTIVHQK